jgi:hypothetical protein
MADQINIIPLNPETFSAEVYSPTDESLITSLNEDNTYDLTTDYVEFFVYSLNNSIIAPFGNDGTFTNYRVLDNELYIDPETDTARAGVTTGTVNNLYNFLRKRLSSSPQSTYYISEISSDRTEIRLDSNIINRAQIIASTNEFISYREQDNTFPDFYLNFGSNKLLIANNIILDTNNTVLIKLYEPLPQDITLKTSLWVVEKISNGLAFRVEFPTTVELPSIPQLTIQGPNYNLSNKDELNNSTDGVSLDSFTSPNSQSEYQINSYFDDPSVNISVDYTDFSNFVNFSSAKSRIDNFWYKVSLIESASEQITSQSAATSTSFTSASLAPLNNIINSTITNFDKYEYYLYFDSSSDTYPKVSSTPPYENLSTGSILAEGWYDAKIVEAENYDEFNQNWLKFAIPEYIRDDANNNQYLEFVNMVGQFVDDSIWIYIKDTTNKWDADNRINAGVSKDLVAQVLRDMGVKLYQNNFSSTDLYSAFLGFTDSGSLFPFPYMTGSVESSPGILDTPDGYEYITNFISSSDEAIPLDDINKRIYKRIYHNLPYLLKSKGTVAGLRTLITSYGIPDTILRISEFGGKDRNNVNDWDLWKHQYNFQYDTNTDGDIQSAWNVNPDWGVQTPQTVQFRFKAPKSGSNAVDNAVTDPQQVLWSLDAIPNIAIGLDYFGGGFVSGSYSGSIPSPSNEYANLVFTTDNFTTTSSVYLPFFNGEWWSVMLTKENDDFTLYAGDKIYDGNDGSQIGFIASASDNFPGSDWDTATNSYFPSLTRADVPPYTPFSGSYQEIRYFNQAISQSVFKDYVMNPQSTEGNGVNGSYNQLAFRATLGGELYTGSVSVHPKVSGSYITQSFASDSNFTITDGGFTTNREWVFYDSPPVGIKNRNTDKIKRQDLILPPGNTSNTGSLGINALSNQRSIQQSSYTTQDYTNNLNLLEVAFSPQNQINDDIIDQIGYFNIGDYIGDPRLVSSSADTYPSLVELSKQYFDKYSSNYDVYDYIRLIKFFDNSLFKMIKDFVPARTGLASGIVVKQHILERQKYPTPQAEWTQPEYTGSIGSTPALLSGSRYYIATTDYESIPIETITGSDGGALPVFVEGTNYTELTYPGAINVTQSWSGINVTKVGDILFTQSDAIEFINGEFSGSTTVATDGELNPGCDVYKVASTTLITYNISGSFIPTFQGFVNQQNLVQGPGEIHIWWEPTIVSQEREYAPGYFDYIWSPAAFTISKESANGIDLDDYIPSVLNYIFQTNYVSGDVTLSGWTPSYFPSYNLGNLELEVINIQEYTTSFSGTGYYLIQLAPNSYNITVLTDNPAGTVAIANKSNVLSVLSPFVPLSFEISDCNPIINNAPINRLSNVYYDVDYSQNSILPVNLGTILNGTALKAQLQDFNYFARRSTIPRYEGSKNGTTTEYSVTGASIDATQAYFAYFNYVGGTSPEWGNGLENRSSVNIRFFLDVNGKIIKPVADSQGINQGIVENNFTEGKIATLAFDDEAGSSAAFSNLIGNSTIFKSGKDITPIVYSQTASISSTGTGGYTGSLTFVQGDQQEDAAIGDYRLTAFADGSQFLLNDNTSVEFGFEQYLGSSGSFTSDVTYQTQTTAPNSVGVTLEFKVKLVPDPITGDGRDGPAEVTFQFMKNGSLVGSSVTVDWFNSSAVFLSYIDSDVDNTDTFLLKATAVDYSQGGQPALSNDSFFKVIQTPPPGIGAVGPGLYSPGFVNYWQFVSGSPAPYTGRKIKPNALMPVYGQKQQDITGSGFFGITNDFIIQVGDEIRFQGTETQTYKIVELDNTPANGDPLHLVLDREINLSNTEMDWFLVRRYIDNPANIILEVDKPAGGTSPGILKPQYLSRNAEDNIDIILEQLRRDTLI